MKYDKCDLQAVARNARNYLSTMVDDAYDYLPYWFIAINEAPAYARHVRVDDAELVASWYEAAVATRKILGEDPRLGAVEQGFKRHVLKSWGPQGLRYHEDYPWSNTNHSAFHEMAYVLGALNRLLQEEPDNAEAEMRAAGLTRGMRGLVDEIQTRTFWSGDFPFDEKVYRFPGDVYLRDGGWCAERVTGRGEESIRNGMMLHSLAVRAEKFSDDAALDLAVGMANYLLGISRYFNCRGEFFGHVHSAVWVASGLARLGRLVGNERYIQKANATYSYVRSISSEFGWVPEYAQWHPMGEENCETCCIKDMIQCSLELIDCGYDYWDVVNKFTRNQLVEQQVKDGSFVAVDNSRVDEIGMTWRDIDKRVVGGWSGGADVNSISLSRFRSIAGCCVGTAPQALHLVWERIIVDRDGTVTINLPMEKQDAVAAVAIGYPNEGYIRVTAKKAGNYRVRRYDWMGSCVEIDVNGRAVPLMYSDGCMLVANVEAGDTVTVKHRLDDVVRTETIQDKQYTVTWRGPDVVQVDPPGVPLQIYQRTEGCRAQPPKPVGSSSGKASMKPTNQK